MTDETKELLEQSVQRNLSVSIDAEFGSDAQKRASEQAEKLANVLIHAEKEKAEALDKIRRGEIEREKLEAAASLEKAKAKAAMKKLIVESAVGFVILGIKIWHLVEERREMFIFEKDERICSTFGRNRRPPGIGF